MNISCLFFHCIRQSLDSQVKISARDHPRMVKISIRANFKINATALAATAAQPSASSRSAR